MRHGDRGSGGSGSAGGCETRRARDAGCGDPRGPRTQGVPGVSHPFPGMGSSLNLLGAMRHGCMQGLAPAARREDRYRELSGKSQRWVGGGVCRGEGH